MNNSDKFRDNPQSGRAVQPSAFKGGGFMGDKDYYNNLGDNRNKPKDEGDRTFQDLYDANTSQQPQTNPQEFADQKKEEVKKTYSTSHSDRINNAYRDNYGRDAHADEIANWTGTGMGIEDIQKGLKTSFARDGEHLKGDQLSALQIQQEPSESSEPTPSEPGPITGGPAQPPSDTQNPVTPSEPSNYEKFKNRFAASDQFRNELNQAKNLGQSQASSSTSQQSNNSYSSSSSSDSRINNNQGLNTSRQRVDNMLDTSNNFSNQLSREADMRNSSPNTQDSTDFVKKYSLLNEDMQRGRPDGRSLVSQYIQMGKDNQAVDIGALDRDIRKGPLYMESKAELKGLQMFGDRYRNARENPLNWSEVSPSPKPEVPDFESIYNKTRDDLNKIEL